MYDFLSKEKEKVETANLFLTASEKHTKKRTISAKHKTITFIQSPVGLGSAFVLGSLKGASGSKNSSSNIVLTLLTKLAANSL